MLEPLTGKHLKVFKEEDYKYLILDGSVSSGKTVTTILKWVDFVLRAPDGRLLMVGKTERTLERNVIDPMITMFGDGIKKVGSAVYIFGRKCYLVGANDLRSEGKIRGLSLVGAYCDEITLYPESFWKMLRNRLRVKGAKLIGTTNPDSPNHYLKKDTLDNPQIKKKIIEHFTLDDNPYLDSEYVQEMKDSYSGLYYQRFILGMWVLAEGVIHSCFNEKIHVVDDIPECDTYYVGVDYGQNNPTVFLLIGIKDNAAYCIKEYYYDGNNEKMRKTDMQFAQDMLDFIQGYDIKNIIVDPSAASFITQLRNLGLTIRKANNDVLNGIRTVSNMLDQERYFIHRSCKKHIGEYYGYVWDDKAQLKGLDAPKKGENDCSHTQDACRYVLHTVMGRGDIQILRI